MEKYMLPCFSKTLFGVECLGCGLQRSLFLLFKGEFSAAFKMYPPVYLVVPFFIAVLLHFTDKQRNYNFAVKWLSVASGMAMIVNYVFKIFTN